MNELLFDATGRQGQIFFTNSGAESNECAIKLARKHGGRGRHTVVSALGSFHGRTLATLAATGQPTKHEPFQPMPEGFRHVAWGDLDAMRAAVDGSVAAVLIEPIQGEGGVHPATTEYLPRHPRAVRRSRRADDDRRDPDRVRAHRPLVRIRGIRGEPRRGDARQGDGQRDAGRGVLGPRRRRRGVRARRPRQHVLGHGDRNGGRRGDDRRDAPHRRSGRCGASGPAADRRAARNSTAWSDVRGRGLLLGAALADGIDAKAVYTDLLDRGLIVNAVNGSTIRLVPPITVTDDEIDEAVALIGDVLAAHLECRR